MTGQANSSFLLIVLAVGVLVMLLQSEPPTPAAGTLAGAARVMDADTLEIGGQRVRLHGIDAPEKRQSCRRSGRAWRCGVAATQALRRRIAGRPVTCTISGNDSDGRALGTRRGRPQRLAGRPRLGAGLPALFRALRGP